MLTCSGGIKFEQYSVQVGSSEDGKAIYMRSLVLGDKEKPPLVFTHGFGSSSTCHFLTFKYLCEHFTVYAFDWIGMGTSDRPEEFSKEFTHK